MLDFLLMFPWRTKPLGSARSESTKAGNAQFDAVPDGCYYQNAYSKLAATRRGVSIGAVDLKVRWFIGHLVFSLTLLRESELCVENS